MNLKTLKQAQIGILLINIGTPLAPTQKAVKKYLREFLSDRRVIDLPNPFRWLLLNLFILPFRPKKSAELYKKIWLKEGSPLLVYSNQLIDALTERLGNNYEIQLG